MPVESTSPVEFGKQKPPASLSQTLLSLPVKICFCSVENEYRIPPRSVSFTKLESNLLKHESGVLESGAGSRGAPKASKIIQLNR